MIKVAIAGVLPKDQWFWEQMNGHLGQIRTFMHREDDQAELRFIASPAYTSPEWFEWASGTGCGVTGYGSAPYPEMEAACDRTVYIEDATTDALGDALCNRTDLLLAVWNEDVLDQGGATWALLKMTLSKRLPCIWISTRTRQTYWQEKTVYDTFEPDKLEQAIHALLDAEIEPIAFEASPSPLLRAGAFLYNRFLGKYRAGNMHNDATEDFMLRDDYQLDLELPGAEECRRRLVAHYQRFDRAAIAFNDLYQAVLYWRAVLPWVTSIFVAIGFYAKGVFKALPLPFMVNWDIVAGIGFLIHGFLNLYVFLLSKSARIKSYQRGMIVNRQLAEMLRILIHFVPFGIYPEVRRLCGENQALYAILRQIVLESEPQIASRRISRAVYEEAFKHTDELLSDQIAYHRRSAERYSKVVAHLERWSRIAFYISFGFILARAGLQFAMSLPQVVIPNHPLPNGVMLEDFIPSFANMLALLFPAWFSYFSGKLSLCNFQFNRDNHRRMLKLLGGEQDNYKHLERIVDVASTEVLQTISESLAEIMTEKDTSVWVKHYEGTRVQHL